MLFFVCFAWLGDVRQMAFSPLNGDLLLVLGNGDGIIGRDRVKQVTVIFSRFTTID
jgi:hypothetical protein